MTVPGNLREVSASTSFVGRSTLVSTTARLVQRQRLTTLIGVGGVGKTRLALEAARRAERSFDGGVWVLQLARVQRVEDALAPAITGEDFAAALGDSRTLVVLDNCEHLLPAAREFAQDLLSRCPQVAILATSRHRLGLPGEAIRAVAPLSFRDGEGGGRSEAARLFLDRAELVMPGSSRLDLGAVEDVCSLLEGVPLAIELAAARLTMLSLEELRDRLKAPLQVLAGAGQSPEPRHRSLRDSIVWSYALCDPDEQRAWRALSGFQSSLSAGDVEFVVSRALHDRGEPLALAESLVYKSVLSRSDEPPVSFALPVPLKEFGRIESERLGEDAAFRQLRLDWCRHFAAEFDRGWMTDRQLLLYGQLLRSLPDLRAGIEDALTRTDGCELVLDILLPLWRPLVELQGRLADVHAWFDRALAIAPESLTPDIALAEVLRGYLTGLWRGLDTARPLLESARRRALDAGLEFEAVCADASEALLGPPDESRLAILERAVELGRTHSRIVNAVGLQVSLVVLHDHLGRSDRADELMTEWLQRTSATGEQLERRFALTGLAVSALSRGQFARAVTHASNAIVMGDGQGPTPTVVMNLETIAGARAAQGDHRGAAVALGLADHANALTPRQAPRLMEVAVDRDGIERAVRDALGDLAFAEFHRDGHDDGARRGITAALGLSPTDPTDRRSPAQPRGLTRRELQIHDLVARGMTNGEIAQALTTSIRTVEWHVRNILIKQGFESRIQIILGSRAEIA